MSAALVLVLDRELRVHLLAAIRNHERTCRRDGYHLPEGLRDLERALVTDTSGHDLSQDDARAAAAPTVAPMHYWTIAETARERRVSERTIRRLINRGELRAERVGRQWRIPVEL